jgi:stearoyl-CoA desaturase (delta-9 desaturase)
MSVNPLITLFEPAPVRPEVARRPPIYWENIIFIVVTHALGIWGITHMIWTRFSWATLGLGLGMLFLCSFSISGGYHRLFAHRAYRSAGVVRLFYLLFGAASFQASALRWASDHRLHHARTDHEDDPYNIQKGFWWAHMGWLFFKGPPSNFRNVKDLQRDPLILFQDRHYLSLSLAFGLLLPTVIAWAWGDAMGGLLVAGFLRLLIQDHATFSINSVAHAIGRRPYSVAVSARDSFLAAFLTLGEGYHNYHHRFPGDYRNGVRFYHYDPTKWCVWALSKIGLTHGLKRVPAAVIRRTREALRRRLAVPAA